MELSSLVGFARLRTTAYHPQTNGMIERQHRTLKTAIVARGQNWLKSLPIVLLGMRSIPNENGFSPSMAVTGSELLLPQLMIDPDSRREDFTSTDVRELAKEMKRINFQEMAESHTHGKRKIYVPKELKKCSKVWLRTDRVRRSLEAPYSGPYIVSERNDKYFKIVTTSGIEQNVSIDRLKPVYMPEEKSNPNDNIDEWNEETVNIEGGDVGESVQPATEDESVEATAEDENECDEDTDEYVDRNEPVVANPEPVRETRSGRRVQFNKNEDFYYF